jgi:hypothetical protein
MFRTAVSRLPEILTEACIPAADAKDRFPGAWKAGKDFVEGTALADWGRSDMNQKLIRELGSMNIRSVEDLAAVSDVHVVRIHDGRMWRSRAMERLRMRPDRQAANELEQEKKRNAELEDRIAKLEKALKAKRLAKKKQRVRTTSPRGLTNEASPRDA